MTFAVFTCHPLATDAGGFPTGGYDTTQTVEATGSDAYVPLDGRWRRRRIVQEVKALYLRKAALQPGYTGFNVRAGTLLSSHLLYHIPL